MEVSPRELSERQLIELLVRWRSGQIDTEELQSAVDGYLQRTGEPSAVRSRVIGIERGFGRFERNEFAEQGDIAWRGDDSRLGSSVSAATNKADRDSFGKLEFPKEELEPYQPLADVLDETARCLDSRFLGHVLLRRRPALQQNLRHLVGAECYYRNLRFDCCCSRHWCLAEQYVD